ncbi:hypothetical protein [Macellibacteroides fermentans]|uniref:hypothetical protein n=1 Tax=Macellibacteroides fermentans TaxID=879969 RepID=UPI00406D0E74
MNHDKLEIILEQLGALSTIWNLLRSASSNAIEKEACEELLLNILEIKIIELRKAIE